MMAILGRFAEAEFEADWDEARARYGDAACAGALERTNAQRRVDALEAIFLAAAASDPRRCGGVSEPLVNLVVDIGTFETHLCRRLGLPSGPVDPASVVRRRLFTGTAREAIMLTDRRCSERVGRPTSRTGAAGAAATTA